MNYLSSENNPPPAPASGGQFPLYHSTQSERCPPLAGVPEGRGWINTNYEL
jgi:hypothetical protein